ncbi:MAG: type II toxin-antitoxin system VapC family toxin [Treponema sp.]|nr:type II toxin-antitoxin system VapC family toxin [Treponema sp.]
MKNIYLLDTNILSQVTKPEPNGNLLANLELHTGTCCISSITWYELQNGISLLPQSPKKDKLFSFLNDYVQPSFPVIPYDIHAASINADITSRLLPIGKPTPILDTQIASIAIANNLILVTNNIRDFKVFRDQFNLMLEDWTE